MKKTGSETKQTPREEAAYWQSRLMSGAMLDQERAAFDAWRAASAENRTAFDELTKALEVVDQASSEALAQAFEEELEALAHATSRSRIQFAAIAATFILVVAAVAGVAWRGFSPVDTERYATLTGEMKKVDLKDGSVIELNTSSAIAVAYNRSTRDVSLTAGEALFTVERDRKRPFIVATAQAEIVVTGTVFDIDVFGGESVVSVVSGVVDVRPKGGGSVTLLAGDRVVVDAAGVAGDVQRFDANQTIAWRHGKLRYREAPLGSVVEDLNRYFEKQIVLADPGLETLPVSGDFDADDQSTAVNALALSFSLTVTEGANRITLSEDKN